jgi:hypothetical protein
MCAYIRRLVHTVRVSARPPSHCADDIGRGVPCARARGRQAGGAATADPHAYRRVSVDFAYSREIHGTVAWETLRLSHGLSYPFAENANGTAALTKGGGATTCSWRGGEGEGVVLHNPCALIRSRRRAQSRCVPDSQRRPGRPSHRLSGTRPRASRRSWSCPAAR